MLDEPPLTVRMRELAEFIDHSTFRPHPIEANFTHSGVAIANVAAADGEGKRV
jgi:hypothetical protein